MYKSLTLDLGDHLNFPSNCTIPGDANHQPFDWKKIKYLKCESSRAL